MANTVKENYSLSNCDDMDNIFETYKYTEHSRCHFEKDVDPENNYYNNISTSCKYYTEQQFNNEVNRNYDGGLSLVHFNARSLSTSFSDIQDLLKSLNVKFDIIAISETWLSKDSSPLYMFNDYDAFHVVRDNRKGGGVVIYVNKKLNGRLCEKKVTNS